MLAHLSIRQRLALWYATLLALTLVLFSVIVFTVACDGSEPMVAIPICRSPGCPGAFASKAIRVLSGDHVGRHASKLPFVI